MLRGGCGDDAGGCMMVPGQGGVACVVGPVGLCYTVVVSDVDCIGGDDGSGGNGCDFCLGCCWCCHAHAKLVGVVIMQCNAAQCCAM